jgi:membrane protein YqaA with SNARE-associated domain
MHFLSAFLAVSTGYSAIWKWLHRVGGPGLIALGIIDNSFIPLPGSVDVFTILLSAHKRGWWPYYAIMATVGAVVGGYLTYRLASKGGHETLERKFGKKRVQGIYKRFEHHGTFWVVLGSILPPPFPIVPFLMAAGVLQYPKKKFLTALTVGRGVRYFGLAYIGHLYGRAIIAFFSQYYRPMLYVVIGLAVAAGVGALVYFKWYRPRHQSEQEAAPRRSDKPEHKIA